MTKTEKQLRSLIGNDLSGVTFVRDFIQLEFNPPPRLNALTKVSVAVKDKVVFQGDNDFANCLIGQINKVVKNVRLLPKVALVIYFEDDSEISISLKPEDYVGAEAIHFFFGQSGLIVI